MLPEGAAQTCHKMAAKDPVRGRADAMFQFLTIRAHELRTPVSAIRTSLEVLRRRDADGPTTEGAKGMIERQWRHMGA